MLSSESVAPGFSLLAVEWEHCYGHLPPPGSQEKQLTRWQAVRKAIGHLPVLLPVAPCALEPASPRPFKDGDPMLSAVFSLLGWIVLSPASAQFLLNSQVSWKSCLYSVSFPLFFWNPFQSDFYPSKPRGHSSMWWRWVPFLNLCPLLTSWIPPSSGFELTVSLSVS